jgi:predicted nuclease with RNAse H fold
VSAARPLAVGVDVAARRGCDVVALDDTLVARPVGRVHTADELRALLAPLTPGVVAIDAPTAWATTGRARACERALAARQVSVFTTPDAARGAASTFYDWMRTGFTMFAGADAYPTLETFPHAVAVALHGAFPARGLLRRPAEKRAWRIAALEAGRVDPTALRTIDEVDAALCALTGLRWLAGVAVTLGDPDEGVITLPGPLPPEPVRRPGTR